jgi:hypothetical protein
LNFEFLLFNYPQKHKCSTTIKQHSTKENKFLKAPPSSKLFAQTYFIFTHHCIMHAQQMNVMRRNEDAMLAAARNQNSSQKKLLYGSQRFY